MDNRFSEGCDDPGARLFDLHCGSDGRVDLADRDAAPKLGFHAGCRPRDSAAACGRLFPIVLGAHWGERTGGFNSLAGVAALFSNQWLLLGGWIHYLAFDLFVGSWEVRDAEERKISYWLAIPCVGLTSMLGQPIGGCSVTLHGAFGGRQELHAEYES